MLTFPAKIRELLRSRPGLNSAIGVVFAVVTGLLLLGYLSNLAEGRGNGPLLDIPVAAADIQAGEIISGHMISARPVASRYVVPGTVKTRAAINGSRALRFIGRGEPFTRSSLSGPGGEGTLSSRIPADLRAYSLTLARGAGAGPLSAGDRVDVLATSGEPPQTATLLRERLVMGVASSQVDGGGSTQAPMSVTLLVLPREAEMLAQAECSGEVSVSLCPVSQAKGPER